MSRIFISHSSVDNAKALALAQWLNESRWTDFFLDVHSDRGIVAGERWLQAFMGAASRCEAVLFLLSPAWCRSKYCTAELVQAKLQGKRIFGLIVEPVEWSELPVEIAADWQVCDLTHGDDLLAFRVARPPIVAETVVEFSGAALEDLARGLRKAGLDARSFAWPPLQEPSREPYRGLDALEELDAGIFFGRDSALVQAIDRIRSMRSRGTENLVVVLGASGAGKSSFLRAGLLPRLRREPEHYLVLPIVRPEGSAITGPHGLIVSLRGGERDELKRSSFDAVKRNLSEQGLPSLLGALLPRLTGDSASIPTVVLPLDQAEELFAADGREESERLIQQLHALQTTTDGPETIVVCTIRSDAWPLLQKTDWLHSANPVLFSLAPIPQTEFKQIIEGPALRHSQNQRPVIVHPLLSERLAAESVGPDALPLLALTLQWLYKHFERGGAVNLRIAEYDALGGVRGVIDTAVARAFQSPDSEPRIPDDPAVRKQQLHKAFVLLATVDPDTGEARRRVASRAELRACGAYVDALVQRLVQQRLVRSDLNVYSEESVEIVELAHESLLRQWNPLAAWLEKSAMQLRRFEQLERAANIWSRHEDERSALLIHRGEELRLAEAVAEDDTLGRRLAPQTRAYLEACRRAVDQERAEREAQQQLVAASQAKTATLQRRAAWLLGIGIVGFGTLLIVTVAQTRRLNEASSVAESRELARLADAAPNLQARLEAAIRAVALSPTDAAKNALTAAVTVNMERQRPSPEPYAVDANGKFVAVAADHGHGAFMELESGRKMPLCGKPENIELLSFSPDGRLLVVVREGTFDGAKSSPFDSRSYERVEYELWSTRDGRLQAQASVEGPVGLVDWAPDSSAFVLRDLNWIGTDASVIHQVKLPSESGGLFFSEDRPFFFMMTAARDSTVSTWTLRGEQLGSLQLDPAEITWALLAKDSSALVIDHFHGVPIDEKIERIDIDDTGKLVKPAKVANTAEFDWSVLKGSTALIDWRVPILEPDAQKKGHVTLQCDLAKANFRVGLGVCVRADLPPVLFDPTSGHSLGELQPWTFGNQYGASLFFSISPDGQTLVLKNTDWLTTWNVATRGLMWSLRENARDVGFAADGTRVVVEAYGGPLFIDAKTGNSVSKLPAAHESIVWINGPAQRFGRVLNMNGVWDARPRIFDNATGRFAITEGRTAKGGVRLTQWDVDRKESLRTLELDTQEQIELKADGKVLRESPTVEALLQIARRRLRRCD